MTEVDQQQEVELFPPKESLQAVELSPRYVPNFNLEPVCRKKRPKVVPGQLLIWGIRAL